MSDEIEDSLHDKIVKAFIRYCTANEKFENFGYIQSARDARAALNDISPDQTQAQRDTRHKN